MPPDILGILAASCRIKITQSCHHHPVFGDSLIDQCSSNSCRSTCYDNDDLAIWEIQSVNTFAMPHSTREPSLNRVSSKFPGDTRNNPRISMEKFPDIVDSLDGQSMYPSSPIVSNNGYAGGPASVDRWPTRRDSALRGSAWTNGQSSGGRHGRQKSLSDALRTIRTRRGSVSANVHEISDALKAPVSPKLIVCQPSLQNRNPILIDVVDSLHCLVYVECPYEHVLEVHPQRVP
jgi:hypothetical protein